MAEILGTRIKQIIKDRSISAERLVKQGFAGTLKAPQTKPALLIGLEIKICTYFLITLWLLATTLAGIQSVIPCACDKNCSTINKDAFTILLKKLILYICEEKYVYLKKYVFHTCSCQTPERKTHKLSCVVLYVKWL